VNATGSMRAGESAIRHNNEFAAKATNVSAVSRATLKDTGAG
jgi:hypothetical protein